MSCYTYTEYQYSHTELPQSHFPPSPTTIQYEVTSVTIHQSVWTPHYKVWPALHTTITNRVPAVAQYRQRGVCKLLGGHSDWEIYSKMKTLVCVKHFNCYTHERNLYNLYHYQKLCMTHMLISTLITITPWAFGPRDGKLCKQVVGVVTGGGHPPHKGIRLIQ